MSDDRERTWTAVTDHVRMGENDAVSWKSSDPNTVEATTKPTARSGTYRVVVQATAVPTIMEIPGVKALVGQQLQVTFGDTAPLGPVGITGDLLHVCDAINGLKYVSATCSTDKLVIEAVSPGTPGVFDVSLLTSGGATGPVPNAKVSVGTDAVVTVNGVNAAARGNQVENVAPGTTLTVKRPGSAVITIGSGASESKSMARNTFLVTSGWFLFLVILAVLYANFWHWSWLESPGTGTQARHLVVGPNLGSVPTGALWFGAVGAVLASWAGIFRHNADWQNSYDYWHWVRPAVGAVLGGVSVLMLTVLLNATQTGTAATPLNTAAGANSRALFFVLAFLVGYREATFRSLIGKVTDLVFGPGSTPNPAATPGSAPPSSAPARSGSATSAGSATPNAASDTTGASAKG